MSTWNCYFVKEEVDGFEVSGQVSTSSGRRFDNGSRNLVVPFDLLRSVWVEAGGKVALLLSGRILLGDPLDLTLELL
jgi:hypothetical protein